MLDMFTKSYIETALWSSTDDNDAPLDSKYGPGDISAALLATIKADCEEFQAANAGLLEPENLDQLGHDFWLTRNHHGAGFWDGDYEKEKGRKLTEASHAYGECWWYVGDDGKIYS